MTKDFLLNLKVGDSVVVKYSGLYDTKSQYIMPKVSKVSKTRFTLEFGAFKKEFKVNVDVYPRESGFHRSSYIEGVCLR
jgi:hypothetical protein